MSKKKCYTNSVHGEDCKNQARDAESQTQGRAEFVRTNTLADRATAGPQPVREEVAVLEEARTKCSERGHVYDCLSFTELFSYFFSEGLPVHVYCVYHSFPSKCPKCLICMMIYLSLPCGFNLLTN